MNEAIYTLCGNEELIEEFYNFNRDIPTAIETSGNPNYETSDPILDYLVEFSKKYPGDLFTLFETTDWDELKHYVMGGKVQTEVRGDYPPFDPAKLEDMT